MLIEKDFKGMRIPPLEKDPDYEKLFKDIPSITEWKAFPPHKRKVINYILLMYDPASPMVKRHQNLIKRREAVVDYVGLSKVKESTLEYVTDHKNPEMLIMIDEFVKWVNIRVWGLIVVNESVFYEYQTELLVQVKADKSKDKLQALMEKNKILGAMDDVSARLETYYSQLYANDKEIEKAIGNKRISPEGIAKGENYA